MGQTRPKGSPKTPGSGRKPGTPNKNSLSLLQKCLDRGIDVFDEMLQIALTTTAPETRFKMFSEISQYLYPKRKALEIEAELDMILAQRVRDVREMPDDEKLKLLKAQVKVLENKKDQSS